MGRTDSQKNANAKLAKKIKAYDKKRGFNLQKSNLVRTMLFVHSQIKLNVWANLILLRTPCADFDSCFIQWALELV